MQISKLQKLDINVSSIGFGCMRLPTVDGKIDYEHGFKMIDHAYNNGVTYYDTAYTYHGGQSETFLGEAMKKYPRDSYYLADKLPIWLINSREDMEKALQTQLEKLQTDYIDFYLIHAINYERFKKCKDLEVFKFLEDMRSQGKIKYIGFSYHDISDTFQEIVDYYNWDFVQIQYNYIDNKLMDGDKLYDILKARNIPAMIMEPTRGGFLSKLPEEIGKIYKDYNNSKSETSWALRWLTSHSNVKVVLSGMSHLDHVIDNVNTFSEDMKLNSEELSLINKVSEAINNIATIPCTGCGYCMPCPVGVDIPTIFKTYNLLKMFGNTWRAFNEYHVYFDKANKANNCVSCGKCEKLCPQLIKIINELGKCHETLEPLGETFAGDPRTQTKL